MTKNKHIKYIKNRKNLVLNLYFEKESQEKSRLY